VKKKLRFLGRIIRCGNRFKQRSFKTSIPKEKKEKMKKKLKKIKIFVMQLLFLRHVHFTRYVVLS